MAATWWEESFFDLQTAASRGWKAVIEAWLTTAEATQEDKKAPDLADQAAIRILAPDELTKRSELAAEHARLDTAIKADDAALTAGEVKELKSARAAVKRVLRAMDAGLLPAARQTLETMPVDEALARAMGELHRRIEKLVADHYADLERQIASWYDNLVANYGVTLRQLEARRDEARGRLQEHLEVLRYV